MRNMKSLALPVATALALLILSIVAYRFWIGPEWETISTIPLVESQVSGRIELVQTLAQISLGILLLGTLYVAWKRATAAERAVEVAQEGQITERFTRAIEQLGSDNIAIRLGGIYALERIAMDSEKDHWQVMEVLTAFVREKSPWKGNFFEPQPLLSITFDIQAILEVLGRRNTEFEGEHHILNLRMTDLRGAELGKANFRRADFRFANLHNAYFKDADLRDVNMFQANVESASFEGADLRGANLSVIWNFDRSQLDSAKTDSTTSFPEGYTLMEE